MRDSRLSRAQGSLTPLPESTDVGDLVAADAASAALFGNVFVTARGQGVGVGIGQEDMPMPK